MRPWGMVFEPGEWDLRWGTEKEEEKIHVRIMELASLCTPAKMVPVKVADEEAKQQAKKERRQQEKERRQASKGKGKGQGKKGKGKARAWSEVKCRDCNQWHPWPECPECGVLMAAQVLQWSCACCQQTITEQDRGKDKGDNKSKAQREW